MGTGVMPLPAAGDVLGKLEGSSALTPALSPRRGRNGRRGRIVRPQRRACSAAISWLRTRPVATIGAGTSQKGRRSKAMAGRRERQPPLLGERAGVRAEFPPRSAGLAEAGAGADASTLRSRATTEDGHPPPRNKSVFNRCFIRG